MQQKFHLCLLVFRRPASVGLRLYSVTLGYYKEGVALDDWKKSKPDILDYFKGEAKKHLGGQGVIVTARPQSLALAREGSVFLSDIVLVVSKSPRHLERLNLPPILSDFDLLNITRRCVIFSLK